MFTEIRDYYGIQRVTFKPDLEQSWDEFLDSLRPVLRQAGIEDVLSHIASLNSQTVEKWHITLELPRNTFSVIVDNPLHSRKVICSGADRCKIESCIHYFPHLPDERCHRDEEINCESAGLSVSCELAS